MSLSFPTSPTLNAEVVISNTTYVYNGAAWKKKTTSSGLKTVAGQTLAGSGDVVIPVSQVGVYATTTALQAAFPAAANTGKEALVGSAAPYTEYVSNGATWQPRATLTALGIDVSLSGTVSNLSGNISSIVRTNGNITSYISSGVTYTITYNVNGSVSTISDGITVKTISYDASGLFISFV
jgi:hypothetical protein